MADDTFAHAGLGSSALMVIGALHANPGQSAAVLVASSSVSRATVYRTLQRLHRHGLAQQDDSAWTLTPRALEGIGVPAEQAVTELGNGWDSLAVATGPPGSRKPSEPSTQLSAPPTEQRLRPWPSTAPPR